MTEQQIPKLAGALVEHQVAFASLGTEDAQWVIQNTVKAINLCVTAIMGRDNDAPQIERTYSILRRVQPESTSVATSIFNASNTFFSKKSSVKMVDCKGNFEIFFAGKVEEGEPHGVLTPLALTRAAYDQEIIFDLGGEENAEVTLAEIWRMMNRQPNGEEGDLLVNGHSNIFYVRDTSGVLRAVRIFWSNSGWFVFALILNGGQWDDNNQVLSRNS